MSTWAVLCGNGWSPLEYVSEFSSKLAGRNPLSEASYGKDQSRTLWRLYDLPVHRCINGTRDAMRSYVFSAPCEKSSMILSVISSCRTVFFWISGRGRNHEEKAFTTSGAQPGFDRERTLHVVRFSRPQGCWTPVGIVAVVIAKE
jgi:hypothetical protein